MILKNLEHEDKNICSYFFTNIKESPIHASLQQEFDAWKKDHIKNYDYYNLIENKILNIS